MRPPVLPPNSLKQIVRILADINDGGLDVLRRAISDGISQRLSESAMKEIADRLELPVETMSYLLGALTFLYERVAPDTSEPARTETIERIVAELGLDTEEDVATLLRARLAELLRYSPDIEKYQKARRLEAGFIASATAFRSLVDIRPSFSADRSRVEGYVAIAQLRIETDSAKDSESSMIFELSPRALAELKVCIEDIEKKLKTVLENGSLGQNLNRP